MPWKYTLAEAFPTRIMVAANLLPSFLISSLDWLAGDLHPSLWVFGKPWESSVGLWGCVQGAGKLSTCWHVPDYSSESQGLDLGVLLDDPVSVLRHLGASWSVPGKQSRARARFCRAGFRREASAGGRNCQQEDLWGFVDFELIQGGLSVFPLPHFPRNL